MRTRRTREQMEELNSLLIALVAKAAPATVRQVFYLATTQALDKTERCYKRVCERLKWLRLEGRILWSQITDMTRWTRKPLTFNNLQSAVEHTRMTYRRAVWHGLNRRVFIVLEKDTLAGVVGQVTDEYDVALLVTRGFSSLTFERSVAEDVNRYAEAGITTYVYALGDWDPSGLKAHATFKERLQEWCQEDNEQFYGFRFSRLAVTPEQIREWGLPSRPTKPSTHAGDWEGGDSVELDAVPPDTLRALVRRVIEHHLPPGHLHALQAAEDNERDVLARMSGLLTDNGKLTDDDNKKKQR